MSRHSVLPTRISSKQVLSIVVPVFNERAMLPVFLERVLPILDSLTVATQLVFVDDGSEDGSANYISSFLARRSGIRLVKLTRNFGKEAALTAGLEHATGDAVVVIDADLQDPPELIPTMVEAWQSGSDVVLMQRRSRHGESLPKRLSAHLFYRLLNRTSRTNDLFLRRQRTFSKWNRRKTNQGPARANAQAAVTRTSKVARSDNKQSLAIRSPKRKRNQGELTG